MLMRQWPKPRPALAPGWTFTTQSASTRASAIARRDKFTRKACGYVDDRRCRPAALPPLPERARKAGKCSPSPTYPQALQSTKLFDQFSGDGIMVSSMIRCRPDPAERAVKMAVAMRETAGTLIAAGVDVADCSGLALGSPRVTQRSVRSASRNALAIPRSAPYAILPLGFALRQRTVNPYRQRVAVAVEETMRSKRSASAP